VSEFHGPLAGNSIIYSAAEERPAPEKGADRPSLLGELGNSDSEIGALKLAAVI